MIIRAAEEKDLKTCEDISKIPELEFAEGGYPKVEFFKEYLDPNFFLIIEEDGKVIGYALGERMKNKVAMLWELTVDNRNRGKGYGKNLLEEFEKRIKANGIEWVVLYTPTFNENSINFYKKMGYNQKHSFYECDKKL